jgi:hypothetical protein
MKSSLSKFNVLFDKHKCQISNLIFQADQLDYTACPANGDPAWLKLSRRFLGHKTTDLNRFQ